MLVKPQLQAAGGGEPAGGYLVWVGAGLPAVVGGSSMLVVDEAPPLMPRLLSARRLGPATVAALAAVAAVVAAASVAVLVVAAR